MSEHSVRIKYTNNYGRETRQSLSYLVYHELGASWYTDEIGRLETIVEDLREVVSGLVEILVAENIMTKDDVHNLVTNRQFEILTDQESGV